MHGYHKCISTTLVYHFGKRQCSAAEALELNQFAGRISARELAGCWVGIQFPFFPWSGSLKPTDDDSYTYSVECCLFLPWACGQQYRRTPGTNTFCVQEKPKDKSPFSLGVTVPKENGDWEDFSSNRCLRANWIPDSCARCSMRIC